jgi:DNA-binding MarR family transcriptional regulator
MSINVVTINDKVMEIEQEIKQTKFTSDYQKAVINLLYTSNWMQNATAKLLKNYNLTEPQYNILRILRGQNGHPISVLDIQSRMLDKMSNASRLIEKLRLKEMVVRKECSNDRRQVDVTINKAGLEILTRLDSVIVQEEEKIKKLNTEEVNQLNKLLDKIRS